MLFRSGGGGADLGFRSLLDSDNDADFGLHVATSADAGSNGANGSNGTNGANGGGGGAGGAGAAATALRARTATALEAAAKLVGGHGGGAGGGGGGGQQGAGGGGGGGGGAAGGGGGAQKCPATGLLNCGINAVTFAAAAGLSDTALIYPAFQPGYVAAGGYGGAGGDGGGGGSGGAGGSGGVGGAGGAGGGALEIRARGSLIVTGAVLANGAAGQGGTSGARGELGALGTAGSTGGSGREAFDYSAAGGTGGAGGRGGTGGDGGSGGAGGGGAGGGGGTIKLVGTTLSVSAGATVSAVGGLGGYNAGDSNRAATGAEGMVFGGSNVRQTTAGPQGTRIVDGAGRDIGSRGANPFFADGRSTAELPGTLASDGAGSEILLVNGAETYGQLKAGGLPAGSLLGALRERVEHAAPAGSLAALGHIHAIGSGSFQTPDFASSDLLVLITIGGIDLPSPALGIVDAAAGLSGFLRPLATGGWRTDPMFGGAGPELLATLESYQWWLTTVPGDAALRYNLTADGLSGAFGFSLALDQWAYLGADGVTFADLPTLVPEPATGWLWMLGLGGLAWRQRRRR